MNALTPDQVLAVPAGELAEQPSESLFQLKNDAADLLAATRAIVEHIDRALDLKYAERAQALRLTAGKDTGVVHFDDGHVRISADLPKRVEWDQRTLAEIVRHITEAGEDPTEYVEIAYRISETKFNAWPGAIRKSFVAARTLKTGNLWRAPDPRPLYNLPGLSQARDVVLVEGEKCAQALIDAGICATTAMNGAKAPAHKTDWTPLEGKHVLIWPDRDAPGWEYAENAGRACVAAGAASVAILVPPADKPDKWDAADAVVEGFDCTAFLAQGERRLVKAPVPRVPTFSLGALLDDDSAFPPDLIAPRVLTPGGLLVFGGAPKVGKSDFLLAWLTHMAAGAPFLDMTPPRPLRVFYLQAEVQYHYLCVEDMVLQLPHGAPDPETGEVSTVVMPVRPTDYKCPRTGALLPVENPEVWIYQEELDA